jgi:hypothetical protein
MLRCNKITAIFDLYAGTPYYTKLVRFGFVGAAQQQHITRLIVHIIVASFNTYPVQLMSSTDLPDDYGMWCLCVVFVWAATEADRHDSASSVFSASFSRMSINAVVRTEQMVTAVLCRHRVARSSFQVASD